MVIILYFRIKLISHGDGVVLKTKDGKSLNIEILNNQEVLDILEDLLPNFAKAIKRCEDIDCNVYKVDYPFGAEIIRNGKIYLPLDNGGSIALNDPMLPDVIAKDLNFNPATEDPLVLVLNKKSEFYYRPSSGRIMSHAIVEPGSMIGIPRATYVPEPGSTLPKSSLCWELNAGARFLFMLAKIADKSKYDKLSKNLKVKIHPPTSTENQWDVFTELAKKCGSPWRSSLLFFPRKWIELITQEDYLAISSYLMHRQRASYNVLHNRIVLWNTALNEIEKQKRMIYAPYVLSTARQFLYIAAQGSVGFKPAINDESAPITFFQEIFENGYGLLDENQSSIIMEPGYINLEDGEPIYYSLNHPILAEHKPDTFKGKSQITLLDELSRAVNSYKSGVIDSYDINIPPDLAQIVTTADFEFYHSNDDPVNYKNIQNSRLIIEEDKRFLFNQKTPFAENSSFFKGCIKIIRKRQ